MNKYFKDVRWWIATLFVVGVTAAFAIGYSPWCWLGIPAYVLLLYVMRNNA